MTDEPRFVPGLELARELSTVVRAIVEMAAPDLEVTSRRAATRQLYD